MKYRVSVRCDAEHCEAEPTLVAAARLTLERQLSAPGDVTVVLTGEDQMRDLNRSYAAKDQATDVLAFSDGTVDPDSGRVYYGDVFIGVPVAEANAKRAGHDVEAELTLLTVHGLLHLLGMDHATPAQRRRMWSLQDQVLADLDRQMSHSASTR
jgi:probable rRNA maturation factor